MKVIENLIYTGADGRESPFDLFLSNGGADKPIVVFAHGYKGFKDWGAWHLVGKAFADAGFDFLKFNFSHNGGTVEQPIDFPDLEAFSKNTYSKELEDLEAISDLITETGIELKGQKRIWKNIALIGHSRGGGIAILHAAKNPAASHLATWASVADFGERFNFDMEAWKHDGVTYVVNGRTKQNMPHLYSYYEDFLENRDELHIESAAKQIDIPWLIAHGSSDEAVDFNHAERLNKWSKDAKLFETAGIGHTFGAIHPWPKNELPEGLEIITAKTIRLFSGSRDL
ncbi:MAG: alpha/beta hydrolase family protein [Cryomorphaceae bacterium]|nr:alpha/beta hydrolase [Flavobacteriales bacterium]